MKRFVWDVLFGRIVPAIAFGFVTFAKAAAASGIDAERSFASAAHFAAELTAFFLYALFTIAVVTRVPRRAGRRDAITIAVVMLGTFGVMVAGIVPRHDEPWREITSAMLITGGLGWALWGLAHLRRSFSLLPEARALVTSGPFALSRHPLYLGEAIAAVGVVVRAPTLLAIGALTVALFAIWMRVRWEEEVLASEFPEYADYAARVPRYLPRPR